MKLDGKVAIITGAARGIGKAIAMKFASEGATVIIADIDMEQAQETVDKIKIHKDKAVAFKVNVANRADVQKLVRDTIENFKTIHILVNNAGISRHAPLLEMTEEEWDTVLAVDLKGVFNCTQAVLGYMIEQLYGKIINISSECGLGASIEGVANYGAAKAGVIQLTKTTALEVGPYGINVNSIAPGLILTDMTYTRRSKEEAERFIKKRAEQADLGRIGSPEDIANLALFLASDDSKHITGQIIRCDGGGHSFI